MMEIWTAEEMADTGGENPMPVYEITNGHVRIAEHVHHKYANLVAAAPEMLAALMRIRETGAFLGAIPCEMMDDAIRKATS